MEGGDPIQQVHRKLVLVLVLKTWILSRYLFFQVSVKKTLQEFKRTHQDNWQDHKQKFSEDELNVLTDLLVSPSYYAWSLQIVSFVFASFSTETTTTLTEYIRAYIEYSRPSTYYSVIPNSSVKALLSLLTAKIRDIDCLSFTNVRL